MRRKSIILIIMAIFAVFTMVNVALAVNRVEVKVTSEPLPYQTPCDKAGSFSLEFDPGTRLSHGDQITADLPINVTICRNIDFVISPYNDCDVLAMTGTGYGFNAPGGLLNIPPRIDPDTNDTTEAPVIYNEGENELNPIASVDITDDGTGGVWFQVKGAVGSRRISVNVFGDSADGDPTDAYLDLGRDADDALIIRFLDQWVNWNAVRTISNAGQNAVFDNPAAFALVSAPGQYSTNGIWIDADNDTVYDETANFEDNTLCINTSLYVPETVNASMDSWADKFTFIPSNPQIAHPMDPQPITPVPCKGATCGRIIIGAGGQFGGTCTNFDNETGVGYCAGTHNANKLVLDAGSNYFEMDADYQVQLTILVNGVEGENGVYFSSDPVAVGASATNLTNTCGWVTTSGGLADTHYRYSNGAYNTAAAPVATDPDCSIASAARAVRVLTDANAFVGANNIRYLYIDFPSMVYDTSQVSEGDQVSIRYELRRFPCGTIYTGEQCVGTFGCAAATVVRQLFYPYFTAFAPEDTFWDGIVITNVDNTNGTATITVYESDGDISSMTATVNAVAQYVNLLSEMAGGLTATANSAGDGTIGNSTCYVVVCTNFDSDGFAMIADTSDQGESMGYLPRNNPAAAATVFQSAGAGAGFDSYDLCD